MTFLSHQTLIPPDHLCARTANHLDGGFRSFDGDIATDDRRTLASERHGGGAGHAPTRARDDAHFSFKPAWRAHG
jgi:hypothetical protein